MFKFVPSVVAATLALSTVVSAKPIPASLVARDFQGQGTFYYQGGAFGACGQVHQDSDFIIALPESQYNGGSHCGQSVTITDQSTGNTQTATVADLCPGCSGDSIDMSVGLFTSFAAESVGVIPVSWNYN
ncbi:hypothetical protein Clacol_007921 [Clathrus columnatus]|uniref:Barwin domain-containing protein n=1 Tax=Clathrus columnatus TaxID=1419009 RepID=A0AAV5AH33_9AGAM|nr:hypothetical protein Clacol_007921 [Clathrus columnatus]